MFGASVYTLKGTKNATCLGGAYIARHGMDGIHFNDFNQPFILHTAHHCNSDGSCTFADTVADVPKHTLTATPVANVHQVCDSLFMFSVYIVLL